MLIAGQSVSVYQAGTPAACESAPITAGQTINGTLAPADCRSVYDPEAYADRFTFTATSAKQLSISLSSNEFDTFLTVLGPDGSVIKVSDDENNGTNSRIPAASGYFLTLPGPGQYTIEVSSFEQVTTGPYTLTLETKDCTVTVSPTELNINGDGGNFSIDVRANEGFFCGWLALSDLTWVTPVPDLGGTRIQLQIDPNTGDVPRTGTINIAGVPVTIRQEIRCRYEVKAETLSAPARGGFINVAVKRLAGALCFWNAPYDDAWISSASVDRTDEGGTARLLIQPNWNLTPRTRTVYLANQPLTITQEASGVGCTALLLERGVRREGALQETSCRTGSYQSAGSNEGPSNRSQFYRFAGRAGEQVTIAMSSAEFPAALSLYDVDGVRIASSGSLIGVNQSLITQALTKDGTYTIEAASSYPNDLGAFTIEVTTQSNTTCAPWLSGFKRHLGTAGGSTSIDVTNSTGTSCEWKAVSPLSWATIDGPTQGTGSGQVKINVAANNGVARSGIITIAGLPLLIVQDGTGIVVVSSAGFDAALAPEGLASVFGDHFSWRAEAAQINPPPTSLWSTTVIVKDSEGVERRAALLYTSRRQVNFQIPAGTKPGAAQIMVRNNEFATDLTGPFSTGTMMIAQVAPRIFTANSTGSGVPAAQILRVKANGGQVYEPVFEFDAMAGNFKPRAIPFGGPGEELYLVIYATGLRNFSSAAAVKAMIGSLNGATTYAGPAPGYFGLDQVNVLLPAALRGSGDASVTLTVDGQNSNMVMLKFAESQSILVTEALEERRR